MAICVSRVLLDGLQKKERLLVVYLEVVGERENWPAGGRLSPRVSPSRAPVFSCAHYFQAPATQATKHLASVACCSKIITLVLPYPPLSIHGSLIVSFGAGTVHGRTFLSFSHLTNSCC